MKLIRNALIVMTVMALAAVSCVSQPSGSSRSGGPVPEWMNELDSVYPDSKYIAAIGSGDTRRDAESDASGAVARRFNVDIKVDTQAERRYRELTSDGKNSSTSDVSVVDKVSSSANEQLKDLKFSDTYVDAKGRTNIVAFLDRETTASLYRSVISKDKSTIDSMKARAETVTSNLVGFAIMDSAVVISMNSDKMLAQLLIVSPSAGKLMSTQVDTQSLIAKRDVFAQKLGYKMTITGDGDGKVAAMVRKSLLTLKIPYNTKGNLEVQGNIFMEPVTVNPKFKSIRWTLTIDLVDENGGSIANVFKESRENAISEAEAKAFAIKEMEKRINSDFLQSLTNYLTKAGQSGK